MRPAIGVAFLALALLGAPLAAVTPVAARDEVKVSIDPNDVAFAYDDGYWDRDHHWHAWRNPDEAEWYRTHYHEHYTARKHDADRDQGWRDADRWWDHR
jgi:hypothetical protein